MNRAVRGWVLPTFAVGLFGVGVLLPLRAECAGPSVGIRGNPGPRLSGPRSAAFAPLTENKLSGGSGQRSGPMTYGYWDGSRFVRTPGPWTAPDSGLRPARQRLR